MSQEAADNQARAIPINPIGDQIEYWNTEAGQAWTARQHSWDTAMQPFSDAALTRAAVKAGERGIDIGGGCGATSLQLAELVGPKGRVLGVDVSRPMLERAKARGAANPVLS